MMMDLKFYFALFLRRIHYFLIFVALGTAIGVTLALALPPVYVSRAVLIVESEQIPDELAAATVRTEASEQLQIIQQRILTRERLLEMANQLQIYATPGTEPPQRMSADDIVADLRTRIRIQVNPGPPGMRGAQATIVTVSFEAPTAAMSAAVTNQVVTMMLQENVAIRTRVAGQTLDFFTQEVDRLDRELATRGAEILNFKENNLDALPDSLDFRRSQQAATQERLLQLTREEAVLRDRRNRLITLYETTGEVIPAGIGGQLTPEAQQLQALRDELTGALAVLSPQNPRVRLLQAQVNALETTVAAQVAAASAAASATAGLGAPVLTPYEIQLADVDGQLDFIADQKDQIQSVLDALRISIEATPGNAIALETLERDYANLRSQYDQAVANRARAETGDMIEALARGQRIAVIEQAIAPQQPESPNRKVIAAGGAGAGFVLGLGIIVLLEFLNTAIRRPADLTTKLGITAFGTLPYIRTRQEIRRRRLLIGLAFVVVLGVIPAGLWWVHTQIMPLDLMLERVLDRLPFLAGLPASDVVPGPGAAPRGMPA
jgi:uncharacterized protein involved in exopolysaccharide biosynthesis